MKKSLAWLIIAFVMISFTAYAASAFDYFTYRTNFEPGSSKTHVQQMTFSGNLTIILPPDFTFTSSTDSYTTSGSNYTWQSNTSTTINYTITSPSNCTEGDIYKSNIYNNNTWIDEFTYVCIDDIKVVDYKVEYGHGCGNYLAQDEPYISNESATLFNLVRVWNIGGYLDPDEDAINATITCYYEDYPVRTYGRAEISYGEPMNGTFFWDLIYGGYWFRIGVLSQDVSGKAVGDTYSVNCTHLTYDFSHQRVVANFPNYTLNVRSPEPIIKNTTLSGSKEIVTLTNNEQYPVYDLVLDFIVDGFVETNHLVKLDPGQSVIYYADPGTNTTVSFVPSWQRHCFAPEYYQQILQNSTNATGNQCPSTTSMSSYAWAENTSKSDAFDLDDYFSDSNNDSLTYTYTGNSSISVTINSTTNVVSFSQPENFTGIEYLVFTADDGTCTTDSNNITLVVYPTNGTTENTTTIVEVRSGSRKSRVYIYVPVNLTEEKECRELWLCTEWSQCTEEGLKERSCEDANECKTQEYMPSLFEECSADEPIVEEPVVIPPVIEKTGEVCRICSVGPFLILLLFILLILLVLPERKHK